MHARLERVVALASDPLSVHSPGLRWLVLSRGPVAGRYFLNGSGDQLPIRCRVVSVKNECLLKTQTDGS